MVESKFRSLVFLFCRVLSLADDINLLNVEKREFYENDKTISSDTKRRQRDLFLKNGRRLNIRLILYSEYISFVHFFVAVSIYTYPFGCPRVGKTSAPRRRSEPGFCSRKDCKGKESQQIQPPARRFCKNPNDLCDLSAF